MAFRKKKKRNLLKWIGLIVFAFIVFSSIALYSYYKKIYLENTRVSELQYLYIPTGSQLDQVIRIVNNQDILIDKSSFEWVANKMELQNSIKPGRYKVHSGMSNHELVSMIRSGDQSPVRFVFASIRSVNRLAALVESNLECDSASLMQLLNDPIYLDSIGFTESSLPALFVPNTYEFYWNTSARQFVARMLTEHTKFWNSDRLNMLADIGLTKNQAVTLASIVEQETNRNDEKSVIAGVYMNRLRDNWKLEADPTLVFAANDFNIRRVLNVHKEIDSPYNTYMYEGLPPGPICIPSIVSIDAVLQYQKHEYYFFCAKEDFSGYHNFAENYKEHLLNARKYQRELNKRNINS